MNVLLYASDENSHYHSQALRFVESCVSGSEVFCLAWPTIMGYLRISTHPSIFVRPLSPDRARENMERLLSLPQVRAIAEEEGFWEVFRETTRGLAARGNLVPDCHLAAILRQHDVRTLFTNDSDFRRFTFLEVRNPLVEERRS